MKKVAIVCAAGKQGTLLVNEAVSRGYDVTGFVRGQDKVANPKAKTVVKDLFDLTREDLVGFDVVIDAFGAWTPETLPLHKTSLAHLCDILSGTKVRLLVVGGAGSLYVNPEHTVQVKDLESFPDVFKPLATNMGEALAQLRKRNDALWTYLSPAGDFVANGGGIIIYHSAAIAGEPGYPEEFVKMMGGAFNFSNGGRKNPKLSFRVDTVKGDPICEDVPDFWYTAQDDLFVNIKWLEGNNVQVLSTVYDGVEDYDFRRMQKHIARDYENLDISSLENINKDHPVMWKNTYGKGRVFVPFIGHGTDTIRRPQFDCLLVRGCEWACSGEVTIPYPDIQEEKRFAAGPYYDNISITKLAQLTEGM